jgi:hypothetical protein
MSEFVKTEKIDEDEIYATKILRKSNRSYCEFIIIVIMISILSLSLIIGFFLTDMLYKNISNYHINDDLFLRKFSLFNQMILIYQFTILKKTRILINNIEIFEQLKQEYFTNVEEVKQGKEDQFAILVNINNMEYIFINNDFCSALTKYVPDYKYEEKCRLIFDGLNLKGYDSMFYTIYENLFFLYDDLIHMIDNRNEIDAYKLMSDAKFMRLVDNYRYVIYELNDLFVGLVNEYVFRSVYVFITLQELIIGMVVIELLSIHIYYIYIDKRLVTVKNIINRIENLVGDTINFCP